MLEGLPQQVAHVKVIEIDAGHTPSFAHKACIEAEAAADDNPKLQSCLCAERAVS
jgi:hypothetical protein